MKLFSDHRESLIGSITFIYSSKPPDSWNLRTERIGLRPNGEFDEN